MYSLLLMTAMVGGPDASGYGWDDGGCYGSCTGYASGCTGYGGCTGSSSCHGGHLFHGGGGCHGGLFHGGGGCNGGGCHGGGFLGHHHGGCHGSSCYGSSCYGSGYGSGCWGSSCYGSGYGGGCWGSAYSSGCGCSGGVAVPVAPVMTVPYAPVPAPAPAPMAPAKEGETPKTSAQAPARLTIELPATAKLYVDGSPVAGTGASRQFHTPDLAAGQAFFYDLTAEVEVNGKVETEAKRVVVRSGEAVTASFEKLVAAAAAGTAVASK